jgi:hypothetical protein
MRERGWEVGFGALAFASLLPLFLVTYPPIQDLPQHLAAVRVLHDFSTPEFRFQEFFQLELGRTQYLAFYLLAHVLAYAFGVTLATKLVVALGIVGLPYALRYLLTGLGRDGRLALFVVPLAWNVHVLYGLFNFVCAIPLALFGLGVAARLRDGWKLWRAIGLGVVALVTFYTHVVPFGFLILGACAVSIGGGFDPTLRRLAPVVPSLFALVYWSRENPAGGAVRAFFRRSENVIGPEAEYESFSALVRDPTRWLTDVLRSSLDTWCFVAWLALVVAAFALGSKPAWRELRLELLVPVAIVAYFVLPASYDWIWPIHGRFPLLACVFALLWLRELRPRFAPFLFAAVALVSIVDIASIGVAFREYERKEQVDVRAAIAVIPPGQKVIGVIWSRSSRQVNVSPFVHSVALYQAERGGAVMFTFADSPQSPFVFVTENRPERVPLGWEWNPESVDAKRDLGWFDWVLTRGGPGGVRASQEFEQVFEREPWRVYRRVRPQPPM